MNLLEIVAHYIEADTPEVDKLRSIAKDARTIYDGLLNKTITDTEKANRDIIALATEAEKLVSILSAEDQKKVKDIASGNLSTNTSGINPSVDAAGLLAKLVAIAGRTGMKHRPMNLLEVVAEYLIVAKKTSQNQTLRGPNVEYQDNTQDTYEGDAEEYEMEGAVDNDTWQMIDELVNIMGGERDFINAYMTDQSNEEVKERLEFLKQQWKSIEEEADYTEEYSTEASKKVKAYTAEDILDKYLETALWSSSHYTDENPDEDIPMDSLVDIHDFSDEALNKSITDINNFLKLAKEQLGEEAVNAMDASSLGHNFWLTRNGHGAGFWDSDDYTDEVGKILTDISDTFGEVYPYIGDDDKVYV